MSDQAAKLRRLTEEATPPVHRKSSSLPLIVVAGCMPGVGATTVAVNVGAALADRGERVLLVDAARQRSNIASVAGIRRSFDSTLSDVVNGKCTAADAIVPGPAGMRLLPDRPTPSTTWDFSRRAQERLFSELKSLEADFDAIVAEVGTRSDAWTRRLWQQAALVTLVSTPDDDAVLAAYAAIKRCAADGIDANIRLLVNQFEVERHATNAQRRLLKSCEQFLSRSIATLPALPKHRGDAGAGGTTSPRVWEMPNTAFGHAALWLGRAVSDALTSPLHDASAQVQHSRKKRELVSHVD
jgi:flagellar biosynthesis protein FlhG